jgi:UV DNA damage endonuclease
MFLILNGLKACLNTILRASKPDPIFCSRFVLCLGPIYTALTFQVNDHRTCRIDTILKRGVDFAKDLGIRNTKDLAKLIQVGLRTFC